MDKTARARKTERFSDVLPRLMTSLGKEKAYQAQLVFHFWDRIVGKGIALHVRPVRMDFHTLFLSADAPVWAHELRYMERRVIDKINAFACAELVKELRFGAPPETRRPVLPSASPVVSEVSDGVVCPNDGERAQAASASAPLAGDGLKRSVARAMAQNLALRRARREAAWTRCGCGRWTPPGEERCARCEREKREETARAARLLFLREPWLHGREAACILGCTPEAAMRARALLLRSLASRVVLGDGTSDEARRLVMLFASVRPEALTEDVMKKVLRRLRFDLLAPERDGEAERIPRGPRPYRRGFSAERTVRGEE